ncbi:MAG: hypothetical protein HOI25_15235, partial [Proteobacteria bacterium]|nr:hypothetical protein [Pseudomonadota bacterium]
MTPLKQWIRLLMVVWVGYLVAGMSPLAAAPLAEPELNAKGEQIRLGYARMLDTLSEEIAA